MRSPVVLSTEIRCTKYPVLSLPCVWGRHRPRIVYVSDSVKLVRCCTSARGSASHYRLRGIQNGDTESWRGGVRVDGGGDCAGMRGGGIYDRGAGSYAGGRGKGIERH